MENHSNTIGQCPLCEGEITESRVAFGCNQWKENGCKFSIWKTIASREIDQDIAKQLLADGKTDVLDGFVSKAGKKFSAQLVLKDGKVSFEFPNHSK